MSEQAPVVLTIAGFDPSSGAGVTADLKVIAAMGAYGVAAITALTVQSTLGVWRTEPVHPGLVLETLQRLADDVEFAAVKIGMLANGAVAEVVADFLEELPAVPAVLDPVVRSSSGAELLDEAGVEVVRGRLLQRMNWVTPNVAELAMLTGARVLSAGDVPAAAGRLREMGGRQLQVVVTGGQLEPPDDYLLTEGGGEWFAGERVETPSTHGTGCAFSTALACRVAMGDEPGTAVRRAKDYVHGALEHAYPVGKGTGPMDHLWTRPPAIR